MNTSNVETSTQWLLWGVVDEAIKCPFPRGLHCTIGTTILTWLGFKIEKIGLDKIGAHVKSITIFFLYIFNDSRH